MLFIFPVEVNVVSKNRKLICKITFLSICSVYFLPYKILLKKTRKYLRKKICLLKPPHPLSVETTGSIPFTSTSFCRLRIAVPRAKASGLIFNYSQNFVSSFVSLHSAVVKQRRPHPQEGEDVVKGWT